MSPAGEVPAAAMCGMGELDRLRVHAERAVAELRAARQAWGVWAEGIRWGAEERLGVTDRADRRVLDDSEYARALGVGMPYIAAVNAAEAVLGAGGGAGAVRAGLPVLPDTRK